MLTRTRTSTGIESLDILFNASPTFTIKVALWEIANFDLAVICSKLGGRIKDDQWVAFEIIGHGVHSNDVVFLELACKVFDQNAGLSETNNQALSDVLPLGWMVSSY